MFYGLSNFYKTGALCRFRNEMCGAADVTFRYIVSKEDMKYEFVGTQSKS